MALVAGVDFGTSSVRVSIVDSERGKIGSAVAQYPLLRKKEDPDYAAQRHQDHLNALVEAMRGALKDGNVRGENILAIAVDTTGSSVVPVDDRMEPIDDYYLWCDHRATREAAEITATACQSKLAAIEWCGGSYSCEWGFAKLLHWLRNNPGKRQRMASALEHCDVMAAVLCGIKDPKTVVRSVCAVGPKWMYKEDLGRLPTDA
jgi:L-ribulokinase